MQERGAPRPTCAEYGHAFPLVDVEAGAAKDPRAHGTSFDSGGVALPDGAGAEGE
jgi:hypothetical protein